MTQRQFIDTYQRHFHETFERVLDTYEVQNAKYNYSWLNDGLDTRALFAEVNAKFQRLKTLAWTNYCQLADDKKSLAAFGDTIDDMILYLAMMRERYVEENPEVGMLLDDLTRKQRDET